MSIVGAVRLDRIWEEKLRENYAAMTREVAPKDLEACVRGLERHIEGSVPEDTLVQCDVCGGWSNEGLTACPYCNDEGPPNLTVKLEPLFLPPQPLPKALSEVADQQKARRKLSSGTGTDGCEGGGQDMARHHEGVEALKELPTAQAEQPKPQESATVVAKAPEPKTESKKSEVVATLPTAPRMDTALVPVPPPGELHRDVIPVRIDTDLVDRLTAAPVCEATLDAATDAIRTFDRAGAKCVSFVGRLLILVRDRLWQQRLEDGKPKHKSFEQYVKTELGYSEGHAKRLVKVAEKFSAAEIEKHGTTKLFHVLSAPKEAQPALMSKLEEGAPVAEVDAEVKKIRDAKHEAAVEAARAAGKEAPKKRGRPPSPAEQKRKIDETYRKQIAQGRNDHAQVAAPKPAKPTTASPLGESSAITIGLKKASGSLPLVRRVKGVKRPLQCSSAKDLVDSTATIEGINGVTVTLRIEKVGNRYVVRYTTKRKAQ